MKVDILKAGGSELRGDALPILAEYLLQATARRDAKTLFVFGGGPQIDAHWNLRHPEPRPKQDGVGITSIEVLKDAVLPAYVEIRASLQKIIPSLHILEPQNLVCERDTNLGFVGNVQSIHNIDSYQNIGIGFVGSDGEMELNINADSIVSALAHMYAASIDKVIVLTELGGVLDRSQQKAPLLSQRDIDQILKGNHATIPATGGMRKKLEEVRVMLKHVPTVLMLKTQELLKRETMQEGTLCVRAADGNFDNQKI